MNEEERVTIEADDLPSEQITVGQEERIAVEIDALLSERQLLRAQLREIIGEPYGVFFMNVDGDTEDEMEASAQAKAKKKVTQSLEAEQRAQEELSGEVQQTVARYIRSQYSPASDSQREQQGSAGTVSARISRTKNEPGESVATRYIRNIYPGPR